MKYIILTILFLTACSSAPLADQQPQATPERIRFEGFAQASPEMTAEAVIAEPTPDLMAQAQATQMDAKKTSDAAAVIVAQEGARQAGIDATALIVKIGATQTLEASHATAVHDQGEQQIRMANATVTGLQAEKDKAQVITDGKKADADKAAAEAEILAAQVASVVGLVVAFAVCAGSIVLLRAMDARRREYELAVDAQEAEERSAAVANTPGDMLPIPQKRAIPISETTLDADTIPPHGAEKFAVFLREWALLSRPLGINSVKAAGYYSQPDYTDVLVWLGKKEALRRAIDPHTGLARFPSLYDVAEADNSRILSGCAGGGMQWAEDWLERHAPPSPIASNTPIQPLPADMTIPNAVIPAEGEVVGATEQEPG